MTRYNLTSTPSRSAISFAVASGRTLNPMMIALDADQGSAAFELWTGEPMPIEYMKEILDIKYD